MKTEKKEIRLPPVAKLVGFRLLSSGKGRAVCELKTGRRHANTMGTVHGGILCALADAAMGFAFMSLIPENAKGATIEFKINFLRPVYFPEIIRASGRTLSRSRSLFYLECELRTLKGELAAKASCTCKLAGPASS